MIISLPLLRLTVHSVVLPSESSWHTECYSSFLNTATCLLSVSLKTRILSFKKFTVILVAPHRKPRVGKFWLLSSTSAAMPSEVWNTECYCGVRYFQLSQLVELRRIRIATFPPNEKANCAEYVAPGFCCITSAALLPKSLGSPFGLTVVANIMQFGGLSMSVTSVAYSLDTECSYTFALIFTAST